MIDPHSALEAVFLFYKVQHKLQVLNLADSGASPPGATSSLKTGSPSGLRDVMVAVLC